MNPVLAYEITEASIMQGGAILFYLLTSFPVIIFTYTIK